MGSSSHSKNKGCPGRVIAGLVLAASIGAVAHGQPIAVPQITPPAGVVVGDLALQQARLRGLPLTMKTTAGRAFRLDALVLGKPVYTATMDLAANRTIRTNLVQTRTVSGVTRPFLTGAAARAVGVWDEAAVRTAHQEFGGRVRQIDGTTELSNHATQVAGMVAAAGIRADAIGAAPSAPVRAFDWNFDLAEMAVEVTKGMKFSNHSYGTEGGWLPQGDANETDISGFGRGTPIWFGDPSLSTQEDANFGVYGFDTAAWDAFGFAAQDFLAVRAAGNERGNSGPSSHAEFVNGQWRRVNAARPADGGTTGFDTILGAAGAKNVLTVGNVNDVNSYTGPSSVVANASSSFGPMDDGRIKPDVVANGTTGIAPNAGGNASYGTFNGTSMAAPSVTGALALIAEREDQLNRVTGLPGPLAFGPQHFSRAATYKGLLIHTADEAGSATGPDYKFGWGLVNVDRAVKQVEDDQVNTIRISENFLINLTKWEMIVESTAFTHGASGGGAAKVTLSWSDPAGLPRFPALDNRNNRALVHDLDVKVERFESNGSSVAETIRPWRLDPNNPSVAATKGDNNVDNVEQVEFTALKSARYRITVSHKGLLTGIGQNFSLLVTGLRQTQLGNLGSQGACCFINGTCSFVNGAICRLQLGNYLGDRSVCLPGNPCPQPRIGACCDTLSGSCTRMSFTDCLAALRNYKGDNTVCSPSLCGQGACCDPVSGACSLKTQLGCGLLSFRAGGVCSPNPCPQPPRGACCNNFDGACTIRSLVDCIASGGTYKGNSTTCTTNRCDRGACCDRFTGVCTISTPGWCGIHYYQGNGTTCTANACMGACCGIFGDCVIKQEQNCIGTYHRSRTSCSPTPCSSGLMAGPPPTGDEQTSVAQQVYVAIEAYLQGDPAMDVNEDGVVNAADLAAVLSGQR